MKIAILKEEENENRCAIVPSIVKKFLQLGATVEIETNTGNSCFINDNEYEKAGATIKKDKKDLLKNADIILGVNRSGEKEISLMKKGSFHISFLDPFKQKNIINAFLKANVNAISLEMLPRTTIAQKMDALSSQANLAGYGAVILGARHLSNILPMMTTPSGTITPANIFIIGVGVAGLQAIATARRLGARVEAFDTRPIVEEQVKSLGAKFIKIDLGQTEQTAQGYAKALTREQLKKQKIGMTNACAKADLVITTAQVFGKKAPLIIDKGMIDKMKAGSIIIDMAIESGGNVEGSIKDEIVEYNSVRILAPSNLPGMIALNASQMLSSNLYNFIRHFWDKEKKELKIQLDNDLLKECLLTYNGAIQNKKIANQG